MATQIQQDSEKWQVKDRPLNGLPVEDELVYDQSIKEPCVNNGPVKVALWAVPRSTSTVFMKCLSGVRDIDVFMELYSYAATCHGLFMNIGRELPAARDGNETVYEEAHQTYEKVTGLKLHPRTMSYVNIKEDLECSTSKFVLIKEVSYFYELYLPYLPSGFKHTFIIRDPTRVYASFRKATMSQMPKLPPNFAVDVDDVMGIQPKTWFEKQHQLWKYVKENFDPNPVVIDTSDLLAQPKTVIMAYCDAVGFPYSDDLLQWKAGSEFPKNVSVAVEDICRHQKDFYAAALNSSHFVAPPTGAIPCDQLTDDVIRCAAYSEPFYREMYAERTGYNSKSLLSQNNNETV